MIDFEAEVRKLYEISSSVPELNMSNYDSDQVADLNNGAIELHTAIHNLLEKVTKNENSKVV